MGNPFTALRGLQKRALARVAPLALAAAALTGAASAAPGGPSGYGHPPRPVIVHAPVHYSGYYPTPRAPRRVWIPGAWVEQHTRVFLPGHTERVWQEPRFEWRYDDCGRAITVQVAAGCWRTVQHPGHWKVEAVSLWRPGHWSHGQR